MKTFTLALALGLVSVCLLASSAIAGESSWLARHGRYSHDPASGARVVQYTPLPRVRALPDAQNLTSGYRRSRTNFRGADGSLETITRVESYGNGRGGIDAEWERFNDVWQRSVLSAGSSYGYGYSPYYGSGFRGRPIYGGGPGFGGPGYGGPGFGGGPAYGHGGGYGAGAVAPPPPSE